MVGPEPLHPARLDGIGPAARVRLDARPGVVSLAGAPTAGGEGLEEADKLEAYYVQNWSLGGDARIVLRWAGRALTGGCADASPKTNRRDTP